MKSRKRLVAGALLAVACYAILSCAVAMNWAWLNVADSWALRWFHDFGVNRPAWIGFWRGVSDVLSPTVLRFIGLAAVVIALIRRKVRVAVFLVLTIGAGGLVTVTAKALSDRPRPDTALTYASSTAFPSGHAMGMTVGVLALLTVVWPGVTRSMRRPAIVLGVALIMVVGIARVALNVHHPSDVLAGSALGFLYYLLCLTVVRPWTSGVAERDYRGAAPD